LSPIAWRFFFSKNFPFSALNQRTNQRFISFYKKQKTQLLTAPKFNQQKTTAPFFSPTCFRALNATML